MAQPSLHSGEPKPQTHGYRLVTVCACVASLASFFWFFWHGELLLYGDAVAHINIARRVFDSRTPGAVQLGSVWLPLPHLLSMPFLVNDWMWRSGVGGSIASMIAYVFAVVGVFRLVRGRASRFAAWLAAGLLGLNPNLLYMQSTAMTESIFLAEVIWAVVYFDEFVRGLRTADSQNYPTLAQSPQRAEPRWGPRRWRTWGTRQSGQLPADKLPHSSKGSLSGPLSGFSSGIAPRLSASKALERCGMVLAAAILTRYDGWVLAFVIGCAAVAIVVSESLWRFRRRCGPASQANCTGPHVAPPTTGSAPQGDTFGDLSPRRVNFGTVPAKQTGRTGVAMRGVRRSLAAFLLLCALTPALWLAHNYAINYKPLDWWNGPYSAQAIEQRTGHGFPYPGKHNLAAGGQAVSESGAAEFFQRLRPATDAAVVGGDAERVADVDAGLAALGTLIAVLSRARRAWAWLLLWLPLPFYAYSIAYGSVPVFLPVWWPFSYYNVRYGLELLPAFAVFAAVATAFIAERVPAGPGRRVAAGALVLLLAANYWKVAEATPICLREARTNSVDRLRLESQLAAVLAGLPPHSTLLMYTRRVRGRAAIGRCASRARGQRNQENGLGCGAELPGTGGGLRDRGEWRSGGAGRGGQSALARKDCRFQHARQAGCDCLSQHVSGTAALGRWHAHSRLGCRIRSESIWRLHIWCIRSLEVSS